MSSLRRAAARLRSQWASAASISSRSYIECVGSRANAENAFGEAALRSSRAREAGPSRSAAAWGMVAAALGATGLSTALAKSDKAPAAPAQTTMGWVYSWFTGGGEGGGAGAGAGAAPPARRIVFVLGGPGEE